MHAQVLKVCHTWTFHEVTISVINEIEEYALESLLSISVWELVDKRKKRGDGNDQKVKCHQGAEIWSLTGLNVIFSALRRKKLNIY